MNYRVVNAFYSDDAGPMAFILGTNEIASAVAVKLHRAGYAVVLSHDPYPPVIRRAMAFHDALFGDPAKVEDVEGRRAESMTEIAAAIAQPATVAVTPLHLSDLLVIRSPDVLVDARMQKYRSTPDYRGIVRLTVGIGPRFAVGENCDIAVDTHPSSNGTIVQDGETQTPDGIARKLGGFGRERFIYADRSGLWHTPVDIGMRIFKGFVLGHLDGIPVHATFDGILRGIARDATQIPSGVKLVEIDPRGRQACWTGIDERGGAIAEATLAAIKLGASRQKTLHVVSDKADC